MALWLQPARASSQKATAVNSRTVEDGPETVAEMKPPRAAAEAAAARSLVVAVDTRDASAKDGRTGRIMPAPTLRDVEAC
jgi:hypothetical protein